MPFHSLAILYHMHKGWCMSRLFFPVLMCCHYQYDVTPYMHSLYYCSLLFYVISNPALCCTQARIVYIDQTHHLIQCQFEKHQRVNYLDAQSSICCVLMQLIVFYAHSLYQSDVKIDLPPKRVVVLYTSLTPLVWTAADAYRWSYT